MVSKEKLIRTIIEGRRECYVKKSPSYNPYTKSELYDWEFRLETDDFIFTDSYRGLIRTAALNMFIKRYKCSRLVL